MKRWSGGLGWLLVLILGGIVLACSWFVVDETQFVILTEFGRPLAVLGDEPGETGLHFKPFWRGTLAIDRRVHVAQPAPREAITGDKRNLEVAPFVVWRVVDPLLFLRAVRTTELASSRLEERVNAAFQDELGRRPFDALASTDPTTWALDDLTGTVRDAIAAPARAELGIEVVDLRLRRFNHPLEVRPAIFDLIRSERKQEAARLRSEGESQYQQIVSRADREREETVAKAESEAATIRARGEAEAMRLLNAAQTRDPEFADFLRQLDAYQALLDDKATVVLPASSPLLRLLLNGPEGTGPAPAAPGTPTVGTSAAAPVPAGADR